MTIAELLATKSLPSSPSSRLDIELLLTTALKKTRDFLYAHSEYKLTPQQQKRFDLLFTRRLKGEPIAYILGQKEFWSFELKVNKNVLIPRPETELLVELALAKCTKKIATVADLGTGSGAIAIALAYERPKWNVIATDISKKALQLARHNAKKAQLKNIRFYCSDWCQSLPKQQFELIISNPPYIAQNDPHLKKGDVRFEPKTALTSDDGLKDLTKIITQAKEYLKPGGWLILEHGYDQSKKAQKLLRQHGYNNITPYQDLAKIDRAVVAMK